MNRTTEQDKKLFPMRFSQEAEAWMPLRSDLMTLLNNGQFKNNDQVTISSAEMTQDEFERLPDEIGAYQPTKH